MTPNKGDNQDNCCLRDGGGDPERDYYQGEIERQEGGVGGSEERRERGKGGKREEGKGRGLSTQHLSSV